MKENLYRARKLIERVDGLGLGREICRDLNLLSSLNTKNSYEYCASVYLDWRDLNELPISQQDKLDDLKVFMEEASEIYQQKTLDQYRRALSLLFKKKLPWFKSQIEAIQNSRDYRLSELLQIISNIADKNAIACLICYLAGLRAHELSELRPINEISKSNSREWSPNRFLLMANYVLFVVAGKGGLRREVAVPNELAMILETRRFLVPKHVRDRKINRILFYDIGFGQALSQSFTRSSMKTLGWSTGLHGLRHSYSKNRMVSLLNSNIEFVEMQEIVSQELGHFRPQVVNTYFR